MDLRFAHTIQITYSPRFIISERIRYGCCSTPYNTVTLPTIQEAKSVHNSNHKLSQDFGYKTFQKIYQNIITFYLHISLLA